MTTSKQLRKPVAALLALVMLLSMLMVPATAAGTGTLTVDNTVIPLIGQGAYTATLETDKPANSANWTQQQWDAWAKSLSWSLTRTAQDYKQDTSIYPYYYTGDLLENWVCWTTTASSTPYFTIQSPVVDYSGTRVTVTLHFSAAPFF